MVSSLERDTPIGFYLIHIGKCDVNSNLPVVSLALVSGDGVSCRCLCRRLKRGDPSPHHRYFHFGPHRQQ